MNDNDVTLNNLITFTANGVDKASYKQIRQALEANFKSIYGNDIDVSTGTADGTFLDNVALIFDASFNTIKKLYDELDIDSTSGKNLDRLCSLANIFRKPASKSTVKLTVTSLDGQISLTNPAFLDSAGRVWNYFGVLALTDTDDSKDIVVSCSEYGPIYICPNSITSCIDSVNVSVSQTVACSVGSDIETDAQLRRRKLMGYTSGYGTVSNLANALLSTRGVMDVKIYNNNTTFAIISVGGISVPAHAILVLVKLKNSTDTSYDDDIAQCIYDNTIPGIVTAGNKSKLVLPSVFTKKVSNFGTSVKWAVSSPMTHNYEVYLRTNSYFKNDYIEPVAKAVMQYLNSRNIGQTPSSFDVCNVALKADPMFRSSHTFSTDGAQPVSPLLDNYFDYTSYSSAEITGSVTRNLKLIFSRS